jgi:hypothetical protein
MLSAVFLNGIDGLDPAICCINADSFSAEQRSQHLSNDARVKPAHDEVGVS